MPLERAIKIYPARPLGDCAADVTVWEARANRADLEEAFGSTTAVDGYANVLITMDAEVRRVSDLYEVVLDPEFSLLVTVHDYPWVLIVNTLDQLEFWEEIVANEGLQPADIVETLDARLRRLPIPEMPPGSGVITKSASKPDQPRFRGGDRKFIQRLPEELRLLGEAILEAVRKRHAGDLRLYSNVGRFVETPDNWWTIKIQPRVMSLVITVRGLPESFSGDEDFEVSPSADAKSVFVRRSAAPADGEIELKRDRGSNSRFTLKHRDQLETAKRVLEWAATNRR